MCEPFFENFNVPMEVYRSARGGDLNYFPHIIVKSRIIIEIKIPTKK